VDLEPHNPDYETPGGTPVMKLTLKLLILTAILVAVAGLCGGWKWGAASNHTAAAGVYAPADANG
jgi:hypothetical protein